MALMHGCVDWSDGKVYFWGFTADCGVCEPDGISKPYTKGCINWSTGQVEVTISNACCDDTYYGCWWPSTGMFEVTIPDACFEPNPIKIKFHGLVDCDYCQGISMPFAKWRDVAAGLNGMEFSLPQGGCIWYLNEEREGMGYLDCFSYPDCTDLQSSWEANRIQIWLYRYGTEDPEGDCIEIFAGVSIDAPQPCLGYGGFFRATYSPDYSKCCGIDNDNVPNSIPCQYAPSSYSPCNGGYAEVY